MKRTIIALIIGLLIGSASTALASNSDYVQAMFSKFNVSINGAEAVEIEPLLLKGTTYYPVRELSGMLGYEVDYIDETRTIMLNSIQGDDEMNTTTELERIEDVDRDVWVLLSDVNDRFGITYIPRATGETILQKDDLEFEFYRNDIANYTTEIIESNDMSLTMKKVLNYVFISIEDLQNAGFID